MAISLFLLLLFVSLCVSSPTTTQHSSSTTKLLSTSTTKHQSSSTAKLLSSSTTKHQSSSTIKLQSSTTIKHQSSTATQQSHAIATQHSYAIDTTYAGSTFFDGWDFFTGQDPNNGFVTYMSHADALNQGLVIPLNPMFMGVDSSTNLTTNGPGRKSVRLTSKKSWNHGLFIADILHMPESVCGIWPAFWMLGPNWPSHGEIDIMEGINRGTHNLMSLHTGANCTMTPGPQYGVSHPMQCDGTKDYGAGCGVGANLTSHNTFGTPFSQNDGGVYATEWTSDHIKIWFFPRGAIPSDITSGNPNPNGWGLPQSFFQGASGCDIDTHFGDMSLVLNTNFCGGWAGSAYTTDKVCTAKASTCPEYVASNPAAFRNSYWQVYSVKVYQ